MSASSWKNALVLGLGRSGAAAARLLMAEGVRVTAVDAAAGEALARTAAALKSEGVEVMLSCERVPAGPFDVCIVSPGVPADSTWVRNAEVSGTEVISELELGARRCRCPLLAITGSSGKSTLVKLCGEALADAGKRVELAGNYGAPLCETVARSEGLDWMVAEVSSFQLEKVVDFRPRVGVLLNVHPNHLDRHGDMRTYVCAKARLFSRMGEGDTAAVYDVNAEEVRSAARCLPASAGGPRWVTFGLSAQADCRYDQTAVGFSDESGRVAVPVSGTMFANDVMGMTAAAAVAAMRGCGADPLAVARAAQRFEPLPHRMRAIDTIRGVRFVDDSKATTLSALAAGVQITGKSVRLIAGGLLKEHDLQLVKETLEKKVRKAYIIGKATDQMADAWEDVVTCSRCGALERAVREAWRDAEEGDTILLSPGCASFDQFNSYKDRGNKFAAIVRSIHEEQ